MPAARDNELPSSPFIRFLRYWLPALVCLSGVIVAAARGFDDIGLEGGAGLVGAGASIWLMNVLLRVGISGERDRDAEDAARRYFDEHGRWPDEDGPAARR
jgi:hypothetical protein